MLVLVGTLGIHESIERRQTGARLITLCHPRMTATAGMQRFAKVTLIRINEKWLRTGFDPVPAGLSLFWELVLRIVSWAFVQPGAQLATALCLPLPDAGKPTAEECAATGTKVKKSPEE